MILIGEKINTVNKDVLAALKKRDESYFKKLAVSQIDSGIIDVLDINVGTDINVEPDNMRWAITCIEEVLKNKIILSIDSPNPKTIIAGINSVHNKKGTFINSITFEENRYKELLPLAKEFNLNIIALPI
ncbi:MAG: dihydropteroate synthase, partial [Cyanobacteria bacterium]|nr:dihydropteroate synthase [Cyanobacteriota bacterium]